MDRWNGRVALVTGASVGIGAAICRELVKHGMTVVGCDRDVDKIRAIAEEDALKIAPGKLVAYKCDLKIERDILALFSEIRTRFCRLDVCVNNAGLGNMAPLLTGATSEWREMLDVNVLALCICTREAVKLMQETGVEDGQIVHISSIAGHRISSVVECNFYSGTKFMVRALTEGLRRELKALNSHIRIASISPGMTETEFMANFLKSDPTHKPEDFYGSIEALQSKDVAGAVLYVIASPPHVEVHDIIVRPVEQTI